MLNFYGGPSGQSFSIAWIFATRYGSGNSMAADISMGWKSPIPVGSYVIISYGLPSNLTYEDYLNVDLTQAPTEDTKRSYNSTLWQKVYNEETSAYNGIDYKFISAMTGNTPKVDFLTPIDVLSADEQPEIIFDKTNPDNPKVLLRLPQGQVLSLNEPIDILNVNEDPYVIYDVGSKNADGTLVPGVNGGTINNPTLTMGLPQSQQIQQGVVHWIKANEDPRFELDFTDINKPVLNFWLPVAQEIQEGNTTILDANESPYFEIDSTDPDNPILNFWLPQSQVMQSPSTNVVGPDKQPNVVLNSDDINKPKLEFELPRAVKFYYGSLLGERQDEIYELTNPAFVDYAVGDYYINAATGFIYLVTEVNGTTCTFKYTACIQQPLPDVTTVGIAPYAADGTQNIPKVVRTFTNNDQTAWKLEFSLPKAPIPAIDATFVGPLEDSSAEVKITDENTMTFDFHIPTGSRMFAGELVDTGKYDTVVPDAKPGDLYLNAKTGMVYILQKSGIWEIQQGSLKGPVGDALHVVRSYETTDEDKFEIGRDLIISQYIDDGGNPLPYKPDEIFAVTFKDTVLEKETAYWYFYTEEGKWGRVQLTGGVMNLIENVYQESPESSPITNKTYSIDYINKLIGGKIDSGNADKTAFSKDQIYNLASWGTWDDAIAGIDIPEPENHDTLSAEEVIELLSWGSIAKLMV